MSDSHNITKFGSSIDECCSHLTDSSNNLLDQRPGLGARCAGGAIAADLISVSRGQKFQGRIPLVTIAGVAGKLDGDKSFDVYGLIPVRVKLVNHRYGNDGSEAKVGDGT